MGGKTGAFANLADFSTNSVDDKRHSIPVRRKFSITDGSQVWQPGIAKIMYLRHPFRLSGRHPASLSA